MMNLQNAIWLSWILATLAIFIAEPRWGGLTYLLATLLAPYGIFNGGELLIRADLILPPIMLGCQFLGISRTRPHVSLFPVIWLFVLWLLWIAVVTIVTDRESHLVSANGYIRLVMVMIIFAWIPWQEKDVINYQFVYVMTSMFIAILSVGQVLNIPVLRAVTEQWYSPPGAVVIAMQTDAEELGYLYRAVGVFGNVSPTATYFLLVACLTISLYSSGFEWQYRRWLLPALVASIIGGLATLSATFVGGILLVILVAIFNSDRKRRREILLASSGCFIVLTMFVAVVRFQSESVRAQLDYQCQRLIGGELLADRYSNTEGVLAEAAAELQERLFTGTGWTVTESFSGDSTYFAILYSSGLIGCLPFVAGILSLCIVAYRIGSPGRWSISWTAVMLLGGIGCTSLLLGRLADGWWAVQGMLISQLAMMSRRRMAPLPPSNLRLIPRAWSTRGIKAQTASQAWNTNRQLL